MRLLKPCPEHKHREVSVASWDRWYVRLLREPTLARSNDLAHVERSQFAWTPADPGRTAPGDAWRLSPLGFLHGLTGLTLRVPE